MESELASTISLSPTPRPATGRGVLIGFHWATFVLVTGAVALVLTRELVESSAARQLLLALHRQIGLLVFVLTATRLLVRVRGDHEFGVHATGMHRRLVAMSHGAFYVLLVGLPLLGLAASQARGQAVHLLGLPLPQVLA